MRGNLKIKHHLMLHFPSDFAISTVSLYELYSGIARCRRPQEEAVKVENFIDPLHVIPFDKDAAIQTAKIRWFLESKGQRIGPYDLMLAGQAVALGLTFVTHNTSEFKRVPNLVIEDWDL